MNFSYSILGYIIEAIAIEDINSSIGGMLAKKGDTLLMFQSPTNGLIAIIPVPNEDYFENNTVVAVEAIILEGNKVLYLDHDNYYKGIEQLELIHMNKFKEKYGEFTSHVVTNVYNSICDVGMM